jgi:hypothetical protein
MLLLQRHGRRSCLSRWDAYMLKRAQWIVAVLEIFPKASQKCKYCHVSLVRKLVISDTVNIRKNESQNDSGIDSKRHKNPCGHLSQ